MTTGFGSSAYLTFMRAIAPQSAVESETRKLLQLLDQSDPSLAHAVAQMPVTHSALHEMQFWNGVLAPHPNRDRIGTAAVRFWAAQTLVTTVLRSWFLDTHVRLPEGIASAMETGADGLFELGRSQFDALARATKEIADWINARGARSVALVESPIGNSVPVQVLSDILRMRGVSHEIILWNAPRNDRPNNGRTVKQSAKDCAADTRGFDYVVLLDEVQSGTRFIKLFDALATEVGAERFFPFAMLFDDTSRPDLKTGPQRARLFKRLEDQAALIGYPKLSFEFPLLRLFLLDGSNPAKWASPVIWGGSDLIAGKRKVNLVFMLLDHALDILEDLAQPDSVFRPYLEVAWRQNTQGHVFQFKSGLLESFFACVLRDLPIQDFRQKLNRQARQRFPEDYGGDISLLPQADVEERSAWLRENLLKEATARIGQNGAWTVINALQAVSEASFPNKKPLSRRDADAAPYVLPINDAISSFNRRIRERVVQIVQSL